MAPVSMMVPGSRKRGRGSGDFIDFVTPWIHREVILLDTLGCTGRGAGGALGEVGEDTVQPNTSRPVSAQIGARTGKADTQIEAILAGASSFQQRGSPIILLPERRQIMLSAPWHCSAGAEARGHKTG